jgi:hypothetical protein
MKTVTDKRTGNERHILTVEEFVKIFFDRGNFMAESKANTYKAALQKIREAKKRVEIFFGADGKVLIVDDGPGPDYGLESKKGKAEKPDKVKKEKTEKPDKTEKLNAKIVKRMRQLYKRHGEELGETPKPKAIRRWVVATLFAEHEGVSPVVMEHWLALKGKERKALAEIAFPDQA